MTLEKTLDKAGWADYIRNPEGTHLTLVVCRQAYEDLKDKKRTNQNERAFLEAYREVSGL